MSRQPSIVQQERESASVPLAAVPALLGMRNEEVNYLRRIGELPVSDGDVVSVADIERVRRLRKGIAGKPEGSRQTAASPENQLPAVLDLKGAASYMCLSISTVRTLTEIGKLPVLRFPAVRGIGAMRRLLFSRQALDRFIQASTVQPRSTEESWKSANAKR